MMKTVRSPAASRDRRGKTSVFVLHKGDALALRGSRTPLGEMPTVPFWARGEPSPGWREALPAAPAPVSGHHFAVVAPTPHLRAGNGGRGKAVARRALRGPPASARSPPEGPRQAPPARRAAGRRRPGRGEGWRRGEGGRGTPGLASGGRRRSRAPPCRRG